MLISFYFLRLQRTASVLSHLALMCGVLRCHSAWWTLVRDGLFGNKSWLPCILEKLFVPGSPNLQPYSSGDPNYTTADFVPLASTVTTQTHWTEIDTVANYIRWGTPWFSFVTSFSHAFQSVKCVDPRPHFGWRPGWSLDSGEKLYQSYSSPW